MLECLMVVLWCIFVHCGLCITSTITDIGNPMNIEASPTDMSSVRMNIWIVIWAILGILTLCLISLCIAYICCYLYRTKARRLSTSHHKLVSNVLAVIIAIGEYDDVKDDIENDDNLNSRDVKGSVLINLPIQTDINNLRELFDLLNYKVLPIQNKIYWREDEIIRFLENDVGKELYDNDSNLKYDGLIVCISCHGMKGNIITSDYRTIEKTALHRIISVKYPKTRDIARIFIFDSCEGNEERVKSIIPLIRAPTVKLDEYMIENEEEKHDLRECQPLTPKQGSTPKHIDLESVHRTGRSWTESTKNPDFQLAVVHAANAGFKSKLNRKKGSYVIYEFTQKMKENILNGMHETLGDIFERIQDKLHDLGKQQTVNIFNNGTRYLELRRNGINGINDINDNKHMQQKANGRKYNDIQNNEEAQCVSKMMKKIDTKKGNGDKTNIRYTAMQSYDIGNDDNGDINVFEDCYTSNQTLIMD